MVKQALSVSGLGCDLSEPDRSLGRLHLAEERTDLAEFILAPMLEESSRLRRDLPLIGVGQGTPCVDITADFIDDRSRIVLLLLGRKPLALIEYKYLLCLGLMLL